VLQKSPDHERYAIHRLVREVRREDVTLDGRQEWIDATCTRMADWFQKRRQEFSNLPVFLAEIDHLRAWQEHAVQHAQRHASRLMWLQAYPPFHQGRYRECKEWVERALESMEKSGLVDRELEANLLNDRGFTYHAMGDHKRALEYAEKALAIQRELLGEKHPDTAISLNNIGGEYGALGDHKRALEYVEKALGIQRELFGDKHPNTAESLDQAGGEYGALGDHQRALEYAEKALAIRRELFGEKHPTTATSLNNVGREYRALGDHERALECAAKALAIRREFGEMHPDTIRSVVNVSVAYVEAEKGAKAVVLLDEFLNKLPREHPAYGQLKQRKREVLGEIMGGGFRTHTTHTKGNYPSRPKKKRR